MMSGVFTSFSTVFQSDQDLARAVMKRSVLCARKSAVQVRTEFRLAGFEPPSAVTT